MNNQHATYCFYVKFYFVVPSELTVKCSTNCLLQLICDDNSPVKVSIVVSPDKSCTLHDVRQLQIACLPKSGSNSEWQRSSEGFNCIPRQQSISASPACVRRLNNKDLKRIDKDWTRLDKDWSNTKDVLTVGNEFDLSKHLGHSKWLLDETARHTNIGDAGTINMC